MGSFQQRERNAPTCRRRKRSFTRYCTVKKAAVPLLSAGKARSLPHHVYRSGGV
ncbi:MAG: hypothetical protein JWO59_1668 [Chloroflexi bacterium]|nr:hypothetical protein [Chloroflexota bacterium]